MHEVGSSSVFSGPLYLISGTGKTAFQTEAQIIFPKNGPYRIEYGPYTFENQTLVFREVGEQGAFLPAGAGLVKGGIPVFSVSAVFFLVIFRNVYFESFQKYFFNFRNNFEIDFHLQRIGVGPVIFALGIISLSLAGLVADQKIGMESVFIFSDPHLLISMSLLGIPLALSALVLVFLGMTVRLFPLLFSDIKVFFLLSLAVLTWNLGRFGAPIQRWIDPTLFLLIISSLFYFGRSILFFQVLRKAYRFHIPISLFYICVLNLATFLILLKGIGPYFF